MRIARILPRHLPLLSIGCNSERSPPRITKVPPPGPRTLRQGQLLYHVLPRIARRPRPRRGWPMATS